MPTHELHHTSLTNLPQHCKPSSPFLQDISSWLSICLPTPLAFTTSLLGTMSIISWLFAQLPQIYKNYQLKSTTGLSLSFLVIWCLGDSSNFVGAVLTRQADWQVIIAAYYVFVDIVLVFQFFWYTHFNGVRDNQDTLCQRRGPGDVLHSVSLLEHDAISHISQTDSANIAEPIDMKTGKSANESLGKSLSAHNEKLSSLPQSATPLGGCSPGPLLVPARAALMGTMLFTIVANAAAVGQPHIQSPTFDAPSGSAAEIAGRVISWMSTVLYLSSRPPQLYKNYQRKSVSGLSPLLFTAAFCGNFFYSTSILTNPGAWYDLPPYGGGGWADVHGSDRLEWISRTAPFFLGAFGVLGMDGLMGLQFLMYGSPGDHSVLAKGRDSDKYKVKDDGCWSRARVSMSRWIPSISTSAGRTLVSSSAGALEDQSLLGQEQAQYGAL